MPRMAITSAVLLLLFSASSPAQVQFESKQLGSKAEIEEPYRQKQSEFQQLMAGTLRYEAAKHQPTAAVCTKYFVWRVTWANVQSDFKPAPLRTAMELVREDFENLIRRVNGENNEKNNDEAKDAICKEFTLRFQEIFDLPFEHNRLAHVNAAMLLPDLGKTKNKAVGAYLVNMIKNPKSHEVQRMFAIRGLAEFFPAREFTVLDQERKQYVDQKVRDLELVDSLVMVIEKNWSLAGETDVSEVEAIRYVRREAIKSLARVGTPAIEVYKGKAQGAAVHTFMRVLTDDGMSPSASLTEKIEAALGICQIKSPPPSDYDSQLGIFLVSKFLVEYANDYQNDYPNFKAAGRPKHPWRFHGERLRQGLQLQANNLNNYKDAWKDRAQELVQAANPMFNDIKLHNTVTTSRDNVMRAMERFRPQSTVVFKKLPPLQLKID